MNSFHEGIGSRVIDAASLLLTKGQLSDSVERAVRTQLKAQIEIRGIPGQFDLEILVSVYPAGTLETNTPPKVDEIIQVNVNTPEFLLNLGEKVSDAMTNIRKSGGAVAAVMELECERLDGEKEHFRITVEKSDGGFPRYPGSVIDQDPDEDGNEEDDDHGLLRRL